ncbi:MAG: hypothetical protein IPM60_01590 [Rhodospirillales bacterium]|nr:hypothetical protein [Rhodospirillales bacterium]
MPAIPPEEVFDKRVALIQDDHETLGRLVTAAFDTLGAADKAIAGETIEALYRSNKVHTYSENLLMRLYRYPDRALHGAEHVTLDRLGTEVWERFRADDVEGCRERLEQYAAALENHLNTFDRKLGSFLDEVGAVVK